MKTKKLKHLCVLLCILYGITDAFSQQNEAGIFQELSAIRKEMLEDRFVLSVDQGSEKYLPVLERKLQQVNALLEGKDSGDINLSEECKDLFDWKRRLSSDVDKFGFLIKPEIKEVTDSLKLISQMENRKESNKLTYELLDNFEKRLRKEVLQRYKGKNWIEMQAAMDSVSKICRAVGAVGAKKTVYHGSEVVRSGYSNW